MKIKSISLGWITTKDLAQSKKFFTDVLGLNITSNDAEGWGWLELAPSTGQGMFLGVAQAQENETHKPGDNAVLTFTIEGDIVAAKKELEAKGLEFEGDILEVPGHVKLVSFFDKDHNRFQLVEDLSGQ